MTQPTHSRTVVVICEQGLHARPAQLLARLALQFESDIDLVLDSQRVDAKSILHVLTLGAVQGTTLSVEATGPDAHTAVDAVANLIESDFSSAETVSQESPEV